MKVLQRCFPDFITRNGTLTVANKTAFKDALDTARSVTELRDAAKYVYHLHYLMGQNAIESS